VLLSRSVSLLRLALCTHPEALHISTPQSTKARARFAAVHRPQAPNSGVKHGKDRIAVNAKPLHFETLLMIKFNTQGRAREELHRIGSAPDAFHIRTRRRNKHTTGDKDADDEEEEEEEDACGTVSSECVAAAVEKAGARFQSIPALSDRSIIYPPSNPTAYSLQPTP